MSSRRYTLEDVSFLAESLGHPACVVREGRFVVVNAALARMAGLPPEGLVGRPFTEVVAGEDRARLGERYQRLLAGTAPTDRAVAHTLRTSDGGVRELMLQSTVLPAAEGSSFLLTSMMLVAERQQEVDLAGHAVEVAAALVAARSEAQVRANTCEGLRGAGVSAHFLLPDAAAEVPAGADARLAREALTSGRVVFGGGQALLPTQAYLPLEDTGEVLLLAGGGLPPTSASVLTLFARVVSGTLRAVRLARESARQLTETQLLLELARTTAGTLDMSSILDVSCDFLVKLLDVSNCFILLHDEETRTLKGAAASMAHRALIRTVELDLKSRSLAARVAREREPVAVEDVEGMRAAGEGDCLASLVEHLGEKALLGLPLLSRDELIGVVVVGDTRGPRRFSRELLSLADATVGQIALAIANARLYESLWRSYAELAATRAEMVKRERLAALGELSAIVAHEVRNPLGVIFNAVSSLRRLVGPNGDAGMLLDILAEESDRLNRIVSDLLDFSRPRILEFQPEDVGALVHDAVEAARAQPGGAAVGVAFQASVASDLPAVPVDRRLIRQALVNVMVNSLQAMPRGGVVRVSAGREVREGREQLRIEVADEGPGIPPELLARIFEPFFTTKAKGTGLGLAVVKRIVEEHRGEVVVDSRMGVGTTFTFHLPLAAPAAGVGDD